MEGDPKTALYWKEVSDHLLKASSPFANRNMHLLKALDRIEHMPAEHAPSYAQLHEYKPMLEKQIKAYLENTQNPFALYKQIESMLPKQQPTGLTAEIVQDVVDAKKKTLESIAEANAQISSDDGSAKRAWGFAKYGARKIVSGVSNKVVKTKQQLTAAKDDELYVPRLETEYGLHVKIGEEVGRTAVGKNKVDPLRARECKNYLEVLMNEDIELEAKKIMLRETAAKALTNNEELYAYCQSKLLNVDPREAAIVKKAWTAYKEKKHAK